MTDNPIPEIDLTGPAALPQISAEYATYVRQVAAEIERDNANNPALLEHATALRQSIEGLAPEPIPDTRSPQQIRHDRAFSIEPREPLQYEDVPPTYRDFAAALSLPPDLARVIANELSSGGKADKAELSRLFGDKLDATLKDAQFALDRAPGTKIAATDLTPWALGQLGAWGRHLQKHAASRPRE